MTQARRDKLAVIWPALALAAFAAAIVLRAFVVESHYGDLIGCEGCLFWPAIVQDLWILALAAGLLLGVLAAPFRPLAWLFGLALSVLLLGFLTDVYILDVFGIRLFLADVALYGLSVPLIFEQFSSSVGGLLPAVILIGLLVAFALLPVLLPRRRLRSLLSGLALVSVVAASLAALGPAPDFVNSWIYRNYLQANASTTESVPYSDAFVDALPERVDARLPVTCQAEAPDLRNVIVLIIESWSSYQSAAFGGHLDWTPELDALAVANTRFTRLHAGGFSTNEGLVNILGGVRLWVPFKHLFDAAEFGHAWGIDDGLPAVFNRAGFHTAFLTTGPLTFLSKGEWLKDLGFDYVEGNQHPFYSDWERVAFQAAADEALYRRALQWIEGESDPPFLLTLETVSTHQPYIHPDTGDYDIEGSFRYADRWAAWFIDRLERAGYFDHGVVVVVSDHRSMTPVSPEEQARFGRGAASRVPMFLIDREWDGPAVLDRVQGLGDIVLGMRQRVGGEWCTDPTQTSPFDVDVGRSGCAFHLRGAERGRVDAFCDSGSGQIVLEGDDTRFVELDGLSRSRQAMLLTAIAKERIAGLRRAREYSRPTGSEANATRGEDD